MGSQWFVITPEYVRYLLSDKYFAAQYREYGQYTMVADENYFVTVMKNSPFCNKHHNRNYLHVQFDQWENQKAGGPDPGKCLQPNPDHCGRSPTLNTIDFLPVLELGHNLFARKFDPDIDRCDLGKECGEQESACARRLRARRARRARARVARAPYAPARARDVKERVIECLRVGARARSRAARM